MRATLIVALLAFGSVLAAPADMFEARTLLDAGDYAGALRAAERHLNWKRHGLEAVLIAARAELGLERYADAVKRLSAAGRTAAGDVERASLYAIALHLDAERDPKLGVNAARARRREAAAVAEQALDAGARSAGLYAARTNALRKLGDFGGARSAALAWLRAAPADVEAREALLAIDAAAARWAALTPPTAEGPQAPASVGGRQDALLARFGPATKEASAAEIESLLGVESDPARRAQLLVLRIAVGASIGRAELAALEALEAGFLDAKRFGSVIRAVRALDPAVPADNDVRLDGASRPERLDAQPVGAGTTASDSGGTVASEVLYRVEPDGRVGIAAAIKISSDVSSVSEIERVRRWRFRPAVRDGRPVPVPQYAWATATTHEETGTIRVGPMF